MPCAAICSGVPLAGYILTMFFYPLPTIFTTLALIFSSNLAVLTCYLFNTTLAIVAGVTSLALLFYHGTAALGIEVTLPMVILMLTGLVFIGSAGALVGMFLSILGEEYDIAKKLSFLPNSLRRRRKSRSKSKSGSRSRSPRCRR